jgi:hypothetical protein
MTLREDPRKKRQAASVWPATLIRCSRSLLLLLLPPPLEEA